MAFLGILFGIAALVWLAHLARYCSVPVAGLAVLVTGTVLGPAYFAFDGPVQISIDRLLWVAVIGVFPILWRLQRIDAKPITRGDAALLFLAALLLVGTQRGGSVPDGSSPLARWVFYILLPLGMYWIARHCALRAVDLQRVWWGLIGLGVYLGFTAICEVARWDALVWPRYIADPRSWEFYGRGRGPLMNPAANGIILSITLAAAILQWPRASRAGQLLLAAAVLLQAAGIYATLTRGVWLGAAAAVALLGMLYAPRWLRVLGLASAIALGGAAAMGWKDQLLRMKRDEHLSAADAEKSVQLRPLLAVVALEMFKDRPIWGFGFGHYHEHAPRYHDQPAYDMPLDQARPYMQHNVLLSMLVDGGLVGLVAFLAVLSYWASRGWQLARHPHASPEARALGLLMLVTLVAYLCNGMFQDVSVIPMVHMFLFFIAGLTLAVAQRGAVSHAKTARAGKRFWTRRGAVPAAAGAPG